MPSMLDAPARATALATLPDWRYDEPAHAIVREFRFADFSAAFGFITRVALAAEQAGHHPDWSNSYGRVTISLSTHSAGGVTDQDITLARLIDTFA